MPTPKNLSSLIPNTLQQIVANDVFSWRIEILELFSPFLSKPILVLNFTTYGLVLLGVVDEKLVVGIKCPPLKKILYSEFQLTQLIKSLIIV